jgi:cholesterol transport system auxiliary component
LPIFQALCLALLLALTACAAPVATSYDLSAPIVAHGFLRGQMAVAEPTGIQIYETDRILVKDSSNAVSTLAGAQWVDRLNRLVQARLLDTLHNASLMAKTSRPGERIAADYQLNTEIKAFQIETSTREAVVELSVKLIDDRTGRVVRTGLFTGRQPVAAIEGAEAARALDEALSQAMSAMVRWLGRR